MGYRSEVAIAMIKDEFLEMTQEMEKNEIDYLIKNADSYYTDVYHECKWDDKQKKYIPISDDIDIVILQWNWIKAYGNDWYFIENFIEKHNGIISIAGEEAGDVENKWYGEGDISWYDYIEAYSAVDIKTKEENKIKDFEELWKKCT